jgi:hypothetical protein
MKWYAFKYRAASALASVQDGAGRLLRAGPARCLRLALALVAGVLALACLVALLLAALLILAPVALCVVVLGGLALAAWPFKLPSIPEAPPEGSASC